MAYVVSGHVSTHLWPDRYTDGVMLAEQAVQLSIVRLQVVQGRRQGTQTPATGADVGGQVFSHLPLIKFNVLQDVHVVVRF